MSSAHVIVGLSGGVDSAVSAALLLEQGHHVEGLFMRNWSEDDAYCSAAEDYASAQSVADQLGIVLHKADFSAAYKERVFAHFLAEYKAGRTPSPDLLCNREIKFGDFAQHARALGAQHIATGHYARIEHLADKSLLCQAADPNKDQTYFLAATPGSALRDVLFPLGDYTKPQVRDMAAERGLHNHQRKDSTGVCFIGERPMRGFLQQYIASQPGPIVDNNGRRIASHDGVAYYTLGQRSGLGIGGVAGAREAPWYVVERRTSSNTLVVSQDREDPRLTHRQLRLGQSYWVNEAPTDGDEVQFRVRHRQALQRARLEKTPKHWLLHSEEPVWAAAEGQYAVIYSGRVCLGCAVIEGAATP